MSSFAQNKNENSFIEPTLSNKIFIVSNALMKRNQKQNFTMTWGVRKYVSKKFWKHLIG